MNLYFFYLFIYFFLIHSSALAEEKLRYAAYNCIAIDADMSPWED